MSTNSELANIKTAIQGISGVEVDLSGTEAALGQIETAIQGIDAFGGSLPGTETALSGLRGDIQALTEAVKCVCNSIQNTAFNDPENHPLFPPTTPATPNDPVVNPPDVGWTICKASYAYIESLAGFFDELADFMDSPVLTFLGVIAMIASAVGLALGTMGAGVVGAFGVAVQIWELVTKGTSSNFRNIADDLRNDASLRRCLAAAFPSGTAAMSTAVDQKMNRSAFEKTTLKTLIIQAGINNYKNGYVKDSVLTFPQADDSDGCDCAEPSGLYFRDYTSTQGILKFRTYGSGAAYVQAPSGINYTEPYQMWYYRWYEIAGDGAGHMQGSIVNTSAVQVSCQMICEATTATTLNNFNVWKYVAGVTTQIQSGNIAATSLPIEHALASQFQVNNFAPSTGTLKVMFLPAA